MIICDKIYKGTLMSLSTLSLTEDSVAAIGLFFISEVKVFAKAVQRENRACLGCMATQQDFPASSLPEWIPWILEIQSS